MKVGVIEAGAPPEPLATLHGSFGEMFARLLGDRFALDVFRATEGELPPNISDYDGLIVTGSAAGINDDLQWIPRLTEFLLRARGKTKLVGVCFGHQLMAHAFGGRVEKARAGWGLGQHRYEIFARTSWMASEELSSIEVPVSHQDQVLTLPEGAINVGGSEFTPLGILAYDHPSISFQCHPEWTPEFAKDLISLRHATRLSEGELSSILATFSKPNQSWQVGRWIVQFLAGQGV